MREIGSEFWDIPYGKQTIKYLPDLKWFLSGRVALKAVIDDIKKTYCKFESISLPAWCCESVILPFIEAGIDVSFYDALKPFSKINSDALLVMDYFGYASNVTLPLFDGIIIRDLTHSFFTKSYTDADYYFGSLRKWAGFWTGGYAWGFKTEICFDKDDLGYINLREEAMNQKKAYLYGCPDTNENALKGKAYLQTFEKAEELLDKLHVLPAASRDIDMAKQLDVEFIRNQRRRNAKVLLDDFSNIAIFPMLGEKDCPMFVPIRVPYRNGLRKYLVDREIYCPVHWPVSKYHNVSEKMKKWYDMELSLICDQRYTEKDMQRIVATIKEYQEMRAQNVDDI